LSFVAKTVSEKSKFSPKPFLSSTVIYIHENTESSPDVNSK